MAVYHVEIREFPRNVNRFNMSGPEVGAVLLAWAQERVFELGDQKWNPQTAELIVIEGPEIPVSGLSMGRGWPTAQREGEDVTARVVAEAREAIVDGSVARAAQAQEAEEAARAAEGAPVSGSGDPSAPADEGTAASGVAAAGAAARAAGLSGSGGAESAAEEEAPPFDEGAGEAAIAAVEGAGGDQLALGVELAALLGPDASRLLAAWREVGARASGLSPSESLALAERRLRDE